MREDRLFIGTRRYSSWSLRGWLAVRMAALDVEETLIPLKGGVTPEIGAVSPNGMVPCLRHAGILIWDSLAIGEYCAELAAESGRHLWPADRALRAQARAVACEMHSGFRELRIAMPMNLGREFPGPKGESRCTPAALADIARIEAIWSGCLAAHGGPFLFGAEFTLADAMFAPVCARFLTWQPELTRRSQDYVAAMRAHPLVDQWYRDAAAEPAEWLLDKYENPA